MEHIIHGAQPVNPSKDKPALQAFHCPNQRIIISCGYNEMKPVSLGNRICILKQAQHLPTSNVVIPAFHSNERKLEGTNTIASGNTKYASDQI